MTHRKDRLSRARAFGLSARKPKDDRKLAILMLTVDAVPNTDLWLKWCGVNKRPLCSLYLNAKNVERLPKSIAKFQIENPVLNTKWGDVSLVRAHIALLKAALKDPFEQLVHASLRR